MTGYCVKCRETREIQNAEQVTMKNGRPATAEPVLSAIPVCTGSARLRSGVTSRREISAGMKR